MNQAKAFVCALGAAAALLAASSVYPWSAEARQAAGAAAGQQSALAAANTPRAGVASRRSPSPPLGLAPIIWPKNNPYTPEKAELGRLLYFDKRLSADNTVACATCHNPTLGFSDGQPASVGIRGQRGGRNAPTVVNRVYGGPQFWDGRAPSLEEQAKGPIANPIEMGETQDNVVAKLRAVTGYRKLFAEAFGTEEFTIDHIGQAIATFERTVLSGNSPYDRYEAGDQQALSPAAVRGRDVFFNKAKCDQCHFGINLTDGAYYNIGVGMEKADPDIGRFTVTKNEWDYGAFKTPTLREIANSAPYMHDGSFKTLEEVVDFYDKGGVANKNRHERIKQLNLTSQEKKDLVEFLKALSGEGWQHVSEPTAFPE